MRRLALLAVLAVLAGCDGDEASSSSGAAGTVAIGELPAPLPTSSTTSTTTTTAPTTTTSLPDASTVLAVELPELFDGATAPAPPMEPVVDDTGQLEILVPAEWTDRRTAPSIAASTDLSAFLDGYEAPGTTGVVVEDSPTVALRAYDFGEDCERVKQGRYETEHLDGRYRAWRGCGGTGTAIVTVGVETDEGTTVVVLAQLLGPADLAALDLTLESISVS